MLARVTTTTLLESLMPAVTPGGSDGQLQFNNNGTFGGTLPNLDASDGTLKVTADLVVFKWSDNTSALTMADAIKRITVPSDLYVGDKILISNYTGSVSTAGSIVAKVPVYDGSSGAIIGYLPVYDDIT